jgi:hypothetical protein
MRRAFGVRIDEAVSRVASLQAESHGLRVGASQENQRKILELEAEAVPEQQAAGVIAWQLHELHQTQNDLQLEIERQRATLSLSQCKKS